MTNIINYLTSNLENKWYLAYFLIIAVCYILYFITKNVVMKSISHFFKKTSTNFDDILLDIKYNICFLARKSLIIDHNIPHSSVELRENRYIFPRIDDKVLFTFWTYHLILDKVEPSLSSTYKMHNNFYKISWKSLVKSNFFILWTNLIFKNNSNKAIKLIKLFYISNNFFIKFIFNIFN